MRKKFGAYLKITMIFLVFFLIGIGVMIFIRQWIHLSPHKVSQRLVLKWGPREKIIKSSLNHCENSRQLPAKGLVSCHVDVVELKLKYVGHPPYDSRWKIWCCDLIDLAGAKGPYLSRPRHWKFIVVDSLEVKQKCENFLRMIDRPEVKKRIESPLAPPPKFNRADSQFIYALKLVWPACTTYCEGSFAAAKIRISSGKAPRAVYVIPYKGRFPAVPLLGERKSPSQAAIKKIEAAVRAFRAVIENFPGEKYFGSYSQLYIGLLTYIGPRGHIGALEELSRVIRKYPRQRDACIMAQYYIGEVL